VGALNPKRKTHGIVNLPRISVFPLQQKGDRFLNMLGMNFRGARHGVTFGNGRHRTEFLRSNGVKVMPFETRKSNVDILEKECAVR